MKSKYVDIPSMCQIIGAIYNNPKILDNDDKYKFNKEDFYDSFHQLVFSAIYNLYQLGAQEITLHSIEDYLAPRPKAAAEYKVNKGVEFILHCAENAQPQNFYYYYNRLKKMSLFRAYEEMGMNLDFIYDPNQLDTKKLQEQEDFIDNTSLLSIVDIINNKIDNIRMTYVDETEDDTTKLGDKLEELVESFKESPALGYPFYTKFMNTITRGMRLGKFYLRSAPTGVGKSRSMIADACYLGCEQMFDTETQKWISIGKAQPTLYIATEQDQDEVSTMALAFIAGVDEDHILKGEYFSGEYERVMKGIQILRGGKLYFNCIPDFSLQDIENIIKKNIRENDICYCFYDYIHSSAKILMEVGGNGGVKNLREDNVLFLLSSKLKEIAVQYGIFVMSSTQLNAQYMDTDTPDQSCLRGSKAIADRIDVGMIMLDVTKEDKEKLQPFCTKNSIPMPTVKISIYKNRGNRYRGIYLWINADKGCCRFDGNNFITDWNYGVMDIEDIRIKVEESSAF